MSDDSKKVLFFVISPLQNLRTVSAFLSKRNFTVYIETDIRDSLVKIIELQPDFIFLAWDHPDKKITTLPKLLLQASVASVVPFITTNTNEAIIKFSNDPINPKLFPPISGPAVERLILKSSKQDIELLSKQNLIKAKLKNKEDLLLMQQKLIGDLDLENAQELQSAIPNASREEFKGPPVSELKTQGPGVIIQKGIARARGPGIIIQKGAPSVFREHVSKEKLKFRAYCISVFTGTRCGYFLIATIAPLDFAGIKTIFSDWIKMQSDSTEELTEQDFFEFEGIEQRNLNEILSLAEYSENLVLENYDVSISFFPLDQEAMKIELNDEKNYIRIKTENIPVGQPLDFSLMIHLPENKKYLLYTQANTPLEPSQKERLLKNKIEILYTPFEYETKYRKFLASRLFAGLYQNISSKLGASS